MSSNSVKVGIAQTGSVYNEDPSSMVPKTIEFIRQASDEGVKILSFCELFLNPFFPNRLEEDFDHFFTEVDGELITSLVAAGKEHNVALVLPFAEKAKTGYYNSTLISNSQGEIVGTYRKTHIPAYFPNDEIGGTGSYEKFYFTPGNDLPVFNVEGLTIGVQICNDRLYPEGSRVLALRGADVIFMPIAYSVYNDPEHRNSIWELALRSRAFENGVYVVAANKVGTEGERKHLGRSMIVDPTGRKITEASSSDEELIVHEVDKTKVSAARKKFPWWRDRRPELYMDIATL